MGCRRKGGSLRIEVHDTGPGIAEHNQTVIFQEFERLVAGQGTEPGLGLGLSIVERIARMMRHPLRLTSKTRPWLVLRHHGADGAAKRARRAPEGNSFAAGQPRGWAHHPRHGQRAADPRGDAGVARGLGGARHHWRAAAAEALAAFAAQMADIDVILADYHLNREDGLELIERLRPGGPADAGYTHHRRPVAPHPGRASERGVQYLRKPVRPAALRAALAQFAARTQAAE